MGKAFTSQGEILAVTLNHSQEEVYASVCRNPNNHDQAVLEYHNGDVQMVGWEDITFVRSLKLDEWEVGII